MQSQEEEEEDEIKLLSINYMIPVRIPVTIT
jgi:hypothetical protein